MKIIITGCAGMIGCYLTSSILEKYSSSNNNEIVGIDNLSRGKLSNLKEACKDRYEHLTFLNADLTEFKNTWVDHFSNADIVIHLADIVAGIGFVFQNESYIFRTNLIINSNVSKAIALHKPKRYIYVGTACSFPRSLQLSVEGLPLKESDQFPASPESGYGWSKLMGEIEAGYLANEGITNTVVLSLHNVYGRYCDFSSKTSQVIPSLCMKAINASKTNKKIIIWGDGNQGRAFVHAKDVVKAIIKSFKKGENQGTIQIGPDSCTKINDLATIIVKKLEEDLVINHDLDKPIGDIGRCADYSKANKLLNWQPEITLEDGIKDLTSWLLEK